MRDRKGFGLIALFLGLLLIGVLFLVWQKQTGMRPAAGSARQPSAPKRIIDKAKTAADSANTRQADTERQMKEMGL